MPSPSYQRHRPHVCPRCGCLADASGCTNRICSRSPMLASTDDYPLVGRRIAALLAEHDRRHAEDVKDMRACGYFVGCSSLVIGTAHLYLAVAGRYPVLPALCFVVAYYSTGAVALIRSRQLKRHP